MTNDTIRAVVITGKYAVPTSPGEIRNNMVEDSISQRTVRLPETMHGH